MPIRQTRSAFLVLLAVAVACSDDDGDGGLVEPPTPAGSPPSVLATVSLSDAPVEGELVLTPPEDGAVWDFAVDLDGDGAFDDAEGEIEAERRVPYRFDAVGIHPIAVRFEHSGTARTEERIVAVNDPDAFVIERRFLFDSDRARPEGIAVTRDDAHLFVGGGFVRKVFRLRTDDLSVVDSVSLRELSTNTLQGLALSPSEVRLFVMNKNGTVTTLSAPELEVLEHLAEGTRSQTFIEAPDERHVIVSGGVDDVVERVDTEAGSITAQQNVPASWDIELSPARDAVAVVTITAFFGQPARIQLLSAATLESRWITEISGGLVLTAVAFHPSGDRIYAFGWDDEAFWLFVVAANDGDVLKRVRVAPHGGLTLGLEGPNPAATTHDGRFVVFPTEKGAYLMDTSLDVPRFRLGDPGADATLGSEIGCCNVATPESTNAIYFVNFGEVFKARLTR